MASGSIRWSNNCGAAFALLQCPKLAFSPGATDLKNRTDQPEPPHAFSIR
jgi:hypothetical protein